jgi:hypothetical protein
MPGLGNLAHIDRHIHVEKLPFVPRIGRIVMVRGTDALDVAMITSFVDHELPCFRVWTTEMPAGISDDEVLDMLQTLPPHREKGPSFGPIV